MYIGIIGSGKLGICKALCLDNAGYDVICYDINKSILENIKNKTLNSNEQFVSEMLLKSNIQIANSEEEILKLCDVIFVYIQTPSLNSGEYDHSYINNFIDNIKNKSETRKIIAISSTIMPEYTDSIKEKLDIMNYDICYNPTFIAQGSIINNLINPELILIGGYCEKSMNIIESIHKSIIKNNTTYHKMSSLEAEITKISINCFITSKITFANMIGDLLTSKNIIPSSVLNAIGSDSRIGNNYLKYGYGFGGPCFPRDNRALLNYANKNNFEFDICKTTDKLNNDHLIYQFNEIKKSNNEYEFTYITYKDNSDILEESQKLKLAIMLAEAGLKITIKERKQIIDKLKQSYNNFNYIEII